MFISTQSDLDARSSFTNKSSFDSWRICIQSSEMCSNPNVLLVQNLLCRFEVETSATFLENECYNKYGKTGKTFYYSQVASTVRWLSTTTSVELTDRLGTITSFPLENVSTKAETPAATFPVVYQAHRETTTEEVQSCIGSQTPTCDSPLESTSPNAEPPPIPSFSEFINSRKAKDIPSRSSKRQTADRVDKDLEKRMRSR